MVSRFGVFGSGLRVSRFRVTGTWVSRLWVRGSGFLVSLFDSGFVRFEVRGFWFGDFGLRFRVSRFRLVVSRFVVRGFGVSGSWFHGSGFSRFGVCLFEVWGFVFRVSRFEGFGLGV